MSVRSQPGSPRKVGALFGIRKTWRPLFRTDRLELRPPQHDDYKAWSTLRNDSREFLQVWEPDWASDHLTATSFRARVKWASRSIDDGRAAPLLLIRSRDQEIIGGLTIDNIRRGPAMACTFGYWVGEQHARRGYMTETLIAARQYVFDELGLSRVEAACLPENKSSRGLLEKCGFKYEGVAQSYLQIAGRWRTHVLYAALRDDRRGASDAG